jgi:ribosome-associated protein
MSEENSIRLDQFLKFVGAVGTGGQAKHVIRAEEVKVNGQIETRRSLKLVSGDVISFNGEEYEVTWE